MAARKLFGLIVILCGCTSGEFSAKRVSSSLKPHSEWSIPTPSEKEIDDLKQIFGCPFKFLGEGAQAYAFESYDGKYVLKLFKMRRFTPSLIDYLCPHVVRRRLKNLKWVFNGYKIGYDEFRRDTALIFIHLAKTAYLNQKATLIDAAGELHTLDLDKTEFVLQEKAELFFDRLTQWKKKGDLQAVERGIAAALDLVKRRAEKGYADRDKAVSNNYGFVEDRIVQLDIGRLYKGIKAGQWEHLSRRIEKWRHDQDKSENSN